MTDTFFDARLVEVANVLRPEVPVPTILVTPDPVGPTRTRELQGVGMDVRHASRLAPILSGRILPGDLAGLQRQGAVLEAWYDAPQYAGYPAWLGARSLGPLTTGTVVKGLDDVRAFTHSDELAKAGAEGAGVLVAVCDSGLDDSHPMLEGQVAGHLLFTGEEGAIGQDGDGHGTWCGSAIAGLPVEYQGKVAELRGHILQGMAPKAQLLDCRVLDKDGTGTTSQIIQGIEAAVMRGARIVSLSLGSLFGGAGRTPDAMVVNEAAKRGVACVIAAGNSFGYLTVGSPGSAAGAITVGAVAMEVPTPDTVATFSCLAKGTPVILRGGKKVIEEVEVGDEVLALHEDTMLLEPARITAVMRKGVQIVRRLRVAGREISATDNHPFLRLERRGEGRSVRYERKWRRLEELRVGDYVAVTVDVPSDGGTPYEMPQTVPSQKPVTIPPVSTTGLSYLVGAYFGDGNHRRRKKPSGRESGEVQFSVPIGDKARSRVIHEIETTFRVAPKLDVGYIHIYSLQVQELFANLGCNGHAHEKRLPRWVYAIPREQKVALLEGYHDTDGHTDKDGNWRFTSVSRGLLEDVQLLAHMAGLPTGGIYRQKMPKEPPRIHGRAINTTQAYVLVIPVARRRRGFRGTKDASFASHTSGHIGFARIQAITTEGEAETFDLTVEPHGSFIANGIVVHNSKGPTSDGRIKPDIAAPGGNFLANVASETLLGATSGAIAQESGESYALMAGTSMATPPVAGIIAQAVPLGFPSDRDAVEGVLAVSGRGRFGPVVKNNRTGWGVVDARRLVQALEHSIPLPTRGWVSLQTARARPVAGVVAGLVARAQNLPVAPHTTRLRLPIQ